MKTSRKISLSIFLALAAIVLPAQSLPPASIYHTITETWAAPANWNGTGPSIPCSGTVTTLYCVSSYTETLTPPPGVAGSIILTVPGSSVSNPWAPGGALYCGTWSISVVANWIDGTGTPVASAPLTGTTNVACPFTANPATAIKGAVS